MPDSTHSLLTKLSQSPCQALWGIPGSAGHSPAFRSGAGQDSNLAVPGHRAMLEWVVLTQAGRGGQLGCVVVGRAVHQACSSLEAPLQVGITLPRKGRSQRS